MVEDAVMRWREVTPPAPTDPSVDQLLATVDALRDAWKEFIDNVSPDEFAEARRRSLRRHAIETGIIERLYDVDWGVTEALVAEGLALEVAEREGGIDDDAYATIVSQFDALEFLAAMARQGRDVSVGLIRELHTAITRHQLTYEAKDQFGRSQQLELHHGQWKAQSNFVIRPDTSRLECTPPEHVASEMERLVEIYAETGDLHPVARAAWLHHRFICIHPFEDGNGRVARALVLLVLLRSDYAPLVVDRDRRAVYVEALDSANEGDLSPLVRLFGELEIVALRSELERPAKALTAGAGAAEVARAYASALKDTRRRADDDRRAAVAGIATVVQARLQAQLESEGRAIEAAFREVDSAARAHVLAAAPPDPQSTYWRAQLVRVARKVDFFANLNEGSWWVRLHLTVLHQEMRYVVAVQKVGAGETGVVAVTAFAELIPARDLDEEMRPLPTPLIETTSRDSVTLLYSSDPGEHWQDIDDLVSRTLAAAVTEFSRALA
jgi:Fic family protein